MQETMKMQSGLFFKTMQKLTAGISNAQVIQPENKLLAQSEKNPKQCGAISTTESVEAVTTRSGINTAPVLKTPPMVPYVAPQRRSQVQQPVVSENTVVNPEKTVEPAVEAEKPENLVENVPATEKPNNTIANPVPAVLRPVAQKVPFPERLEKTKKEK